MKVGDKIICINNFRFQDKVFTGSVIHYLTMNKYYIVTYVDELRPEYVNIIDDDGDYVELYMNRFVTLKEYRKLKLQKVLDNS